MITPNAEKAALLLQSLEAGKVASLMQDLIRIPSHRWEEGEIASYVAGYLRALGLDVTMQPVVKEGDVHSKQVIGRLPGSGGAPSVMLCGHLDTRTSPPERAPYRPELWTHDPYSGDIVDGWIYGLGAVNMKGGVTAMLEAVRAIRQAGLQPKGDVVVAAVMGETAGGLGVEYMLDAGVRADMAIVTECTDMDIVTVAVSACRGHIHVEGETAHHLPHKSAVQVAAELITAMGPSFAPIPPDGWLPYAPHPDLPGYPRFAFRQAQSYGGDFCRLSYDCRIIPGITPDDVQHHLQRHVDGLGIKGRVEQPPHPHIRNRPTAFGVEDDHPVIQVLSRHFESVLGRPASVGAGKRLGGAADASNLLAASIPTVTFGPGVIDVWPMVDERCALSDVVAATRTLTLTVAELTSA